MVGAALGRRATRLAGALTCDGKMLGTLALDTAHMVMRALATVAVAHTGAAGQQAVTLLAIEWPVALQV